MILADSFTSSMFKQSFVKVFEKDKDENLRMGFQAPLEVRTSKDLKITRFLRSVMLMKSKATNISNTEVGLRGTNI